MAVPIFPFARLRRAGVCIVAKRRRKHGAQARESRLSQTAETEDREFAGVACAMDRFGLKEAVLVTHAQSDLVNRNGRKIKVVPAHEYLENVGTGP